MKPKCKLCRSPHWTYEEHTLKGTEALQKVGASVLRNTVTKPSDENVTESVDSVTSAPTTSTVRISSYTHGGARERSGRKKEHRSNAERQKAYRDRSITK